MSSKRKKSSVHVVGPVDEVRVYMPGQTLTQVDPKKQYTNAVICLSTPQDVFAKGCIIQGHRVNLHGDNNFVVGDGCTIYGSGNTIEGDGATLYGSRHIAFGNDFILYGNNHVVTSSERVSVVYGSNHRVTAARVGTLYGSGHTVAWSRNLDGTYGSNIKTRQIPRAELDEIVEKSLCIVLETREKRLEVLKKETPRESNIPTMVMQSSGGTITNFFGGNGFVSFGSVVSGPGSTIRVINVDGSEEEDSSSSSSSSSSSAEQRKRRRKAKEEKSEKEKERPAAAAPPPKPPKLPVNWKQDPIKLKEGQEDGGCTVCMDYRADAMVQPCGMLCMCMGCARKIAAPEDAVCPICKVKIEYIQGVRLM